MSGLTERIIRKDQITAVSALFLATATAAFSLFHPLIRSTSVEFSRGDLRQSLEWVSQVHWKVDRLEVTPTHIEDVLKVAVADQVASPITVPVVRSRVRHTSQQHVNIHQRRGSVPTSVRLSYQDRIQIIRSAVDREYFAQEPSPTSGTIVEAYRSLQAQFLVAANTQSEVKAETQIATVLQQNEIKERVLNVNSRAHSSRVEQRRKRVAYHRSSSRPVKSTAKIVQAPKRDYPASPVSFSKNLTTQDTLKVVRASATQLALNETALNRGDEAEGQAQVHLRGFTSGFLDLDHVMGSSPKPSGDLKQNETASLASPGLVASPGSAAVSESVNLSQGGVMTTHTRGQLRSSVTTHTEYPSPALPTRPNGYPIGNSETRDATPLSFATATRQANAEFIEALDPKSAITGVSSSTLSFEGSSTGKQARWMISDSAGYWPTLALRQPGKKGTPLLSLSALQWLSLAAKVKPQKEAGMVLVRLASGWDLKLSARAETVIFFDSEGRITADRNSGATFGLYLNVEPGGHLVHLSNSESKLLGAVGVPILAGTMTFLGLEEIEIHSLSGIVLDASSGARPRPLKDVHVSTADQTKTAFTHSDGRFQLDEVVTLGENPVIIETNFGTGFSHRHQIRREQFKDSTLFRFSAKQYDDWVSQLEGGVSPQSGLLVAAVPEAVLSHSDTRLFPGTVPVLANPTLTGETYTVSARGFLKPRTELGRDTSRYISVQLSDGYHLTQLKTPEGQILWSEMVRVSPDVINVVRSR